MSCFNGCRNGDCISRYQFVKIIPNHTEYMPACDKCGIELLMCLIVTRNQERKLMNITSMGWCRNGCIEHIFRNVTDFARHHHSLDRSYRDKWPGDHWLEKEDWPIGKPYPVIGGKL